MLDTQRQSLSLATNTCTAPLREEGEDRTSPPEDWFVTQRVTHGGIPVGARLTNIYTFAALIAGVAGALLTQTTQFVGIDVLSFQRSADLLVMLIIGGAATLYGGFIGAAAFLLAQDRLASLNAQYWLFWLGILLIVMTLYLRGGILGGFARLAILFNRWRKGARA